ncbi:MAG: glycosyltransferase [Oscillospiraceae bacterium]|nr:glycosyltransferase [Oscillospiraceae bacterium]
MKFSLLISVYAKENPHFLKKCLDSISSQTMLPDELIIVKDGPLPSVLERVLSDFHFPNDMQIIALPKNITQGPARAIGIEAARNAWVAVMDSDDICRPDRFEKQLAMIESNSELSLIGGQISEFGDNPDDALAVRKVPLSHDDIVTYAKCRNPLSQMTVMLKRDLAISAGNYRYFPCFEDYDLWVRMIKNGAICANHPEVLVDARVGGGMYERRRGIAYIRYEWKMQKQLLRLGYIGFFRFILNLAMRIPVRLLPGKLLAQLYNMFARSK